MEVFLSELAATKLEELTEYLLSKWGYKVKNEYLVKLTKKIAQIELQPESCPKSNELGGIYKCVLTKQNTFYYRVNFQIKEIEIITFFDTRQDPDRLKKQL
jgi:plasmid stabilization system protein ParE